MKTTTLTQHQNKTISLKWLTILRVFLGLSLLIKGIRFIQNKSEIAQVFHESLILQKYYGLQTIIPWLNLLCGVFIIIGLYTRVAVIIQIPILIGAIVFVNTKKGMFAGESELAFSILILVLLVVFLFFGGGFLSYDKSLRNDKKGNSYPEQ